jgi:uncharacterized membrane protein YidH (DUF202 family)
MSRNNYFRYIGCSAHLSSDQRLTSAIISLNISIYLLVFGVIATIAGVVTREVSPSIANTNSEYSVDSDSYRIGTIILIFGSVCIWLGFTFMAFAIIKFQINERNLRQNGTNSLHSISNDNFDINLSPNNNFDYTFERPPPYSETAN